MTSRTLIFKWKIKGGLVDQKGIGNSRWWRIYEGRIVEGRFIDVN